MKNLKVLISYIVSLVLLIVVSSCKDDDTEPDVNFITGTGETVNINGNWDSGCVSFEGMNLSQTFIFSKESIVINVRLFTDTNCENQAGSDRVTIDYRLEESFQVTLAGSTVLANKISGIATTDSDGSSENFRQALYIDDSQTELALYIGDDNGPQTSDGYPMELIPIAITRN